MTFAAQEPWPDSPAAHASTQAKKIKYLESLSLHPEYEAFVSNVTFDWDGEGFDVRSMLGNHRSLTVPPG